MDTGTIGVAVATFLASAVEFAEAFTIVLAMGITRGWRSALAGTVAAIVALVAITWLVGAALATWLPEGLLRLIVGTLLLIFGLQWLRKAILRTAGLLPNRDEAEVFRRERETGSKAGARGGTEIDWFGFVVSFKGVLLEGLEVVLIVLTFAAGGGELPAAAGGAAAAAVLVLLVGLATRRPLTRISDTTLKFAVGVLLSTFGTFWAVEGLGMFAAAEAVEWPGGDWALLGLLVAWVVAARLAVRALRGRAPVDVVSTG